MPQLLQNGRNLIDKMVRSQGKMPIEAWKALKKARVKKTGSQTCGPSKQSVYDYVHGHRFLFLRFLWDDVRCHPKT